MNGIAFISHFTQPESRLNHGGHGDTEKMGVLLTDDRRAFGDTLACSRAVADSAKCPTFGTLRVSVSFVVRNARRAASGSLCGVGKSSLDKVQASELKRAHDCDSEGNPARMRSGETARRSRPARSLRALGKRIRHPPVRTIATGRSLFAKTPAQLAPKSEHIICD